MSGRQTAAGDPTVELDEGVLTGRRIETPDGDEPLAFFGGIPYAAPPVGALRFAHPAPPTWSGPRDARAFGPSAPQFRVDGAPFDLRCIGAPAEPVGEDYLALNVWTPFAALDGGEPRPVIVYVHGGAFTGGSGSAPAYDAQAFARSGLVAVTINYRLGVPGFAHLPGAPDNRGLLDQLAALRWVREHAAAFGGDPERVTIFGESAGSISVCALAAAAPPGLFGRVISQSGGSHGLSVEQAAVASRLVAERLGAEPTVTGFAAVSDDVLAATLTQCVLAGIDLAVGGATDPTMRLSPFGPVIDDELLTDTPAAMITAGSGPDVDLLVGSNTEELNLYTVLLGAGVPDDAALRAVVARLHPEPDALIAGYREAGRASTPNELFAAIGTDRVFAVPTLRMAEAQLARAGRVWWYEFGWRSPARGGALGACHGIELPFVFDGVGRVDYGDLGVRDDTPTRALAADVHARWVGFARDGDPGWPASTDLAGPQPLGVDAVADHPERDLWTGVI
ncbi:para-nitrobenzyl esterase [Friedmanniella endophytica]|uniref:Carboxylic ester hydrolase n=1 Tax=Microlunatus kandeliicorticis TaxID=1759536 RepID=A0A7W3IT02_9ACTN|nr:carboxylesterase family protein [Microlunatus kandeliicorticis]MBA8794708.1 para-nitrobenzyl esterase [Microlunatus kandeliicorticis]